MALDPSTLIDAVDTAILKTLTSQSYSAPGGRQQQMAALSTLKEFRQELKAEQALASSGGGSMMSLLVLERDPK